jgi:hypothetical protein
MATGDGRKSRANFARLQSNRVCDWAEHDCGVRLLLCVQRTVAPNFLESPIVLVDSYSEARQMAPSWQVLCLSALIPVTAGITGGKTAFPWRSYGMRGLPLVTRIVGYFPCFDLDGARICQRELHWSLCVPTRRRRRCFWPRVTTYLNG